MTQINAGISPNSSYYFILLRITPYHFVLLRITLYLSVLLRISLYYFIFFRITLYFSVLFCIFPYYFVLPRNLRIPISQNAVKIYFVSINMLFTADQVSLSHHIFHHMPSIHSRSFQSCRFWEHIPEAPHKGLHLNFSNE